MFRFYRKIQMNYKKNQNMNFNFNSTVEDQEQFYSGYTIPPQVQGGVAIDLGCNVGLFSLENYQNFSHIYAIDASYQNFITTLEKLIRLKIDNVNCFNLAASNQSGKIIKIYKNAGLSEHSQVIDSNGNEVYWRPVDSVSALTSEKMLDSLYVNKEDRALIQKGTFHNVYTVSLDGILELFDLNYIDYLKIDIEGAEYDFLLDQDLSRICSMGIEIHGTMGAEKKEQLKKHISEYFDIYEVQYDDEAPGHSVITYINKDLK